MAVAATKTAAPETPAPVPVVAVRPSRQPRKRQLSTSNFKPVGHFKETQQAMLPAGWTFEELFDPDFWASVAPVFQAAEVNTAQNTLGTEIEVRTLDCAFYARLIVMAVRKNEQGQANGLMVECIGPACDPASGVPCAFDLKAKKPIVRVASK